MKLTPGRLVRVWTRKGGQVVGRIVRPTKKGAIVAFEGVAYAAYAGVYVARNSSRIWEEEVPADKLTPG